MILLEEAVERYALAASDYGISVTRRRSARQAHRDLAQFEKRLPGLRLPAEVRHLWATWQPQSFGSLLFDGLYRLEEVGSVHRRDISLGFPPVCLPLTYIEKAGVWVELETDEHPGGRIYHTYYDDAALQLWCVGVSGLLHLVAETIESGGVNDPGSGLPWLDHAVFESIRLERTADLLALPDEWRVDVGKPDAWPAHWKISLDEADSSNRGPTHTVAEFDLAREQGRTIGTLVGEITGLVSGGPIDGMVATLTDDTGSIQVYGSVEVEAAFAKLEVGSRREVDVIGEPSSGRVRPRRSGRGFMLRRTNEELSASQLRLLEQMRRLDVGVAVTAVRPT